MTFKNVVLPTQLASLDIEKLEWTRGAGCASGEGSVDEAANRFHWKHWLENFPSLCWKLSLCWLELFPLKFNRSDNFHHTFWDLRSRRPRWHGAEWEPGGGRWGTRHCSLSGNGDMTSKTKESFCKKKSKASKIIPNIAIDSAILYSIIYIIMLYFSADWQIVLYWLCYIAFCAEGRIG